jgi:polyvinyl alcohol dehydrogenase (cytochrome)
MKMKIERWALLLAASAGWLLSQTPQAAPANGEQVYTRECATCHNTAATSAAGTRAPSREALRSMSANAVVAALSGGKMITQGARLNAAELNAVAEFVTGQVIVNATANAGTCAAARSKDAFSGSAWNGWGAGLNNARYQTTKVAGITASDVPKLELAWAFGLPNASAARTQPTVTGRWLFTASDTGDVFALDAQTGCTRWTYRAKAAVRTAIALLTRNGTTTVFFGDGQANAYALNARTGQLLWTRKIDDHANASITAAAATYGAHVYYVTSAAGEEVRGQNATYACCSFRGSVTALDVRTGVVAWKSYAITEPSRPRGKSTKGVELVGPAGAGIWGTPTIDPARGVLYLGTGNGFAGPPQPTMNAILAFALKDGALRWTKQTVPNDIWLYQCDAGRQSNPNCPDEQGPDFDFGTSPLLTRTAQGRDLLVVPQKSGVLWALDPDQQGAVVWQYRIGVGSGLGGQWGAASDGRYAYVGVADAQAANPGGMHAVDVSTGQRVWFTPPQPKLCAGGANERCLAAQGGAVTLIPGAVFSGASDGGIRAYSTTDGRILWQYDTNRDFDTVNKIPAKGGSIDATGPVAVGGMLYVNSGYNGIVGRAGNVLLAFKPKK